MTYVYAIADLHGRLDLLELALAEIEKREPGVVIFLGDYIDRGPNPAGVINRLIAGPTESGWKWVCLKGNHEDIMCQARADKRKIPWWLQNGGGATLLSYGQREGQKAKPREYVPLDHIIWIEGLPMIVMDEHRVFVHGGVSHTLKIGEQTEATLLWKLYHAAHDDFDIAYEGLHVVHGHHQFADGPKLYANRTALDCGAYYTNRLVVGVFDDDEDGGPVETIEVTT